MMSTESIRQYAEHRKRAGLTPLSEGPQMKIFATRIPIWEGDTTEYVTAASEEKAAVSRGEQELEADPTVAACFEDGIEIEVINAESGWEPSHFRVWATEEPTFHAQRTDAL